MTFFNQFLLLFHFSQISSILYCFEKRKTERKYFKEEVDIQVLKTLRELTKKCEFILDFEIKENKYAVILDQEKEEVKKCFFFIQVSPFKTLIG